MKLFKKKTVDKNELNIVCGGKAAHQRETYTTDYILLNGEWVLVDDRDDINEAKI